MYAVTSIPFDKRTLAIFLNAEFGFFGVAVFTEVQTPRFWGLEISTALLRNEFNERCKAGDFDFSAEIFLPFLTNWLNVGIIRLLL
jgi:hypothetical protein